MKRTIFTVFGVPKAMPRTSPVAAMRGGKPVISKKTGRPVVIAYTPRGKGKQVHPAVQFKSDVKTAAIEANVPYHDGPVSVNWVAYFPRPKYMKAKKYPTDRIPHHRKPDRDNLDKTILDALTGVAWKDDCQVYAGDIAKYYISSSPTARPHVWIEVIHWEVEE